MDVERVLRPRTLCSSVGRRRRAIYIDPADPLAEAHLKANWQSTRLDSFFYGSYFTNGVQDVVAILRSSAGPSVRRSCNALFVSRLVAFPGSLRMLAKVDGRAKLLRSYGIKKRTRPRTDMVKLYWTASFTLQNPFAIISPSNKHDRGESEKHVEGKGQRCGYPEQRLVCFRRSQRGRSNATPEEDHPSYYRLPPRDVLLLPGLLDIASSRFGNSRLGSW